MTSNRTFLHAVGRSGAAGGKRKTFLKVYYHQRTIQSEVLLPSGSERTLCTMQFFPEVEITSLSEVPKEVTALSSSACLKGAQILAQTQYS